jgi:NTE family protein
MGALHGLVAATGWDPTGADLLVGTSAGAVIGALTASGARPWDALAPDRADLLQALLEAANFRVQLNLRSLTPGSPSLLGRAIRGGPAHVMKAVAGVLPEGFVSTNSIARLISEQAPGGWPAGQKLWIVATDYESGERVVFGRPGSPEAKLAAAVAASCAIPGFYRPVEIGGRRYVDGGVHTGSNLDLLATEQLDLVICLNPLSSRAGVPVVFWPVRMLLHRQLLPQIRSVEQTGSRVVAIEPDGQSVRLIGFNPMNRHRLVEVGVAASLEVQRYLAQAEVSGKLVGLGPPEE